MEDSPATSLAEIIGETRCHVGGFIEGVLRYGGGKEGIGWVSVSGLFMTPLWPPLGNQLMGNDLIRRNLNVLRGRVH